MITLKRWENPDVSAWPSGGLLGPQGVLDRLFEQKINSLEGQTDRFERAPVDLYEETDKFIVKIELPGLKKEEIDVSLEKGALLISGLRKNPTVQNEVKWHRSERFAGAFRRAIQLPVEVKADQVNAHYENGILTVTLPKADTVKPRQINIS